MARFKKDVVQKALANTVKLADVKADDFDTVFYPGGHRPMSGAKVLGAIQSFSRRSLLTAAGVTSVVDSPSIEPNLVSLAKPFDP